MTCEEKEFVARRLQIVEEDLGHLKKYDVDGIKKKYDVDDDGALHFRTEVPPTVEYALVREARILEKLTTEVDEGKVRRALVAWQHLLGGQFKKHNEHYQGMQEVYESWLRLPWPTRVDRPEPPQPPDCEVTDQQGHTWLVDHQLLDVFDDLLQRLDRWMTTNE
jgi:hypothetical protein